ncbi:DNA polymerase III subunit beta [Spirochaetota bacterium]
MKLQIDKETLLKSINTADSIISSKNVNTILSNCLINIMKDNIEIISTDNEVAIRTTIDAVSESSVSLTINGKKLSSILKELPNDELIIDIDDSMVIDIKTKSKEIKGHYSLIGTGADEYPEISKLSDNNSTDIEQGLLKEMIKKVVYAASSDSIKPVFNGVLLISEKGSSVTAVATDSRRLSMITRPIDNIIKIGEKDSGIIIPLKTVNEIFRLLQNTGNCKFLYESNQCFFKINETEIISKIVDGQFPNYKQVIPQDHVLQVEIDTKKFLDSVKRAIIFTKEPANKILLNFKKDSLVIEAKTPELGETEEEIRINSQSDETITLGINAQFLIDALREIDTDLVVCSITGQMSPMKISPKDDENYVSIIMPIQIKST